MDIIDVILGSALTPQGEIESFAARAEKAVADANTALNNIESITDQTNTNNAAAQEALSTVNTALAALEDATIDLVNDEVKKLAVELTTISNQDGSIGQRFTVHYPDNSTQVINNVAKYYTNSGNNTDGTMTQRAITEAIRTAVNSIVIPSTNLGAQNANKIVIVGPDGTIIPSANVTEESIMNDTYGGGGSGSGDTPSDPSVNPGTGIVGLKINYANAIITPTDDAADTSLTNFNALKMYGGRTKCLVDDNGTVVAFYGDSNYVDDPTNGYQVMIYQPKFYYKRTPTQLASSNYGPIIKEEVLQLSDKARTGFKIHPLFIDENGNELEYVLLSAYEGSIESEQETSYLDVKYTDFAQTKLSSVSGAKPISGINNNFNANVAEKLATNRGVGWHINTTKALSAQQMLAIVELKTLNIQDAIGEGIGRISEGTNNSLYAANTGSTKNLGNVSGIAASTTFNYDNVNHYEIDEGKTAVSYRGCENLWGNMWDYLGDLLLQNQSSTAYLPYICNNFTYSNTITSNYHRINFNLPPVAGWISGFAYDEDYDWIFLPIEFSNSANSLIPVGDYFLRSYASSGVQACIHGGPWFGELKNGLFYYAFNRGAGVAGEKHIGARLLFVPQAGNSIYINNIVKWNAKIGG